MSGPVQSCVRNAMSRPIAESTYLRLDCGNDPLTAELDGEAFDTLKATELVDNGTFDTSADWDFGGAWSWNAGQYASMAGSAGATGDLSPSAGHEVPIEVGKWYMLTFEIPMMSNGEVTPSCGGVVGDVAGSPGLKTMIFQAATTDDLNLYGELVTGSGKFFIRLDNVSLIEIGWLRGYTYLLGGQLTGTLAMAAAGASDIGEDGAGIRRLWLDDTLSYGALPGISGMAVRYSGGDFYIGNDNVFPGYYVQKTVLHNSTAADNTDDFTNLYQGNNAYRFIAMMYDLAYDPVNGNGVNIGDGLYGGDPPPLLFGATSADGFELRLDVTNTKMIARSTSDATYLEVGLAGADPALRPDTDGLIDLGDQTNALRWRHLYLSGDAVIGAALDHDGSAAGFFGVAPAAQPADVGALADNTGGAVDGTLAAVSGTGDDATINDNLADLADRVNGLRAALRALGLMA